MKKKSLIWIFILLALVIAIAGEIYFNTQSGKTSNKNEENITSAAENESGEWSFDSLKKGRITVIDAKIRYSAKVPNIEAAEAELRLFGVEQREKYDNPRVERLEKKLEKQYGIYAVNLGEMDIKTAKDVAKAVKYIYKRYPAIRGSLTNITLANLDTFKSGHLAITQNVEFIMNGHDYELPYVEKYEILLSASAFLNRDALLKKCQDGAKENYWPEGMDISTLVVHELGHQVLNVYAMRYFNFENPYYVTEENSEAFYTYISDNLALNQTVPKLVVDTAYERWLKLHDGKSYEDFCKSISGYAQGMQKDGGISYCETVAEAIADIYLNGKNASEASKLIEEVLMEGLQ